MEVSDAARSIVKLIQSSPSLKRQEIVNIGYDEVYSINRLIKFHNEVFGTYLECKIVHPEFIFDLKGYAIEFPRLDFYILSFFL